MTIASSDRRRREIRRFFLTSNRLGRRLTFSFDSRFRIPSCPGWGCRSRAFQTTAIFMRTLMYSQSILRSISEALASKPEYLQAHALEKSTALMYRRPGASKHLGGDSHHSFKHLKAHALEKSTRAHSSPRVLDVAGSTKCPPRPEL